MSWELIISIIAIIGAPLSIAGIIYGACLVHKIGMQNIHNKNK